MLLARNADPNHALAHAVANLLQRLFEPVNSPVRLLLGDAILGLVNIQRRAFYSHSLASLEIVEDDFYALRAEIDTKDCRHSV